MDGWIVAFLLYLIPILPQIVHVDAKQANFQYYMSAILWPPLMVFGSIYYYFLNRKS